MEPSFVYNFRQKANEARQHLERSVDPDVRQMWHDIAEYYEYLAEYVQQQREEQSTGRPQ
jgi:hypothetical protein